MCGGGSGGLVILYSDYISGDGHVYSNGGEGYYYGGGGAGGWIFIYAYESGDFKSGQTTAKGDVSTWWFCPFRDAGCLVHVVDSVYPKLLAVKSETLF